MASDIGQENSAANPLRNSNPPPRCPSLQGNLSGSHRGSFTSGAASPQSLPSIPPLHSNDRSYSVVIGGVAAADMAAWPGYERGALPPTLPSSLPSTAPSSAMAHDTMAGSFYSSPPMMETGTAARLRHLLPYPSPTQRHQAFEGPTVHDGAYEAWIQARSLAMTWEERI